MNQNKWKVAAFAVLIAVSLNSLVFGASESTKTRSTKISGRASSKDTIDTAALERKLDAILEKQEEVLQRFDAVMEELRIIKVRATMQ